MRRTLLAVAIAVSWTAATWAQDMVAVSWTGDVYRLDSSTGAGSLIAASGAVQLNSMAKRSDGKLFTAGGLSGSTTDIYEIDPVTGIATTVVTVPLRSIRSMAFGPADELYATNLSTSPTFGPMDLHLIDLTTGATTLIGDTGTWGIQGMAWGADTLFGFDVGQGSGTGDGLIMIDPSTAVCTDVNPSVPGHADDVQCLTFDSMGTLYGSNDELFEIDISTGVLTLVGSGGYSDLRGMEFDGGSGPSIYCTAKPTSLAGCLPTIMGPATTASVSAGAGSYDVTCGPVPGGPNFGALTYTTLGPLTTPIQNSLGFQCIPTGAGYFVVTPPATSGGTAGTCSGNFVFDFGTWLAGPNPDPALIAGATVDMQCLYRDPPNVGTANLSNALSFALVP